MSEFPTGSTSLFVCNLMREEQRTEEKEIYIMALTRKFLSAMGIEADKVDQIIDAHTETVDALKQERDSFKEKAEKFPAVQKELDELKAAAEKSGKDPFKVKYEALKEEFDAYKKGVENEKTTAKKTAAYRDLLKEAGIREKRIDAVLRVSDVDSIELDEDGKIKDAGKLKKAIAEEWDDFIDKTSEHGAPTATPPSGNGKGKTMTKDEIMAIRDPVQRQAMIAENLDLFV